MPLNAASQAAIELLGQLGVPPLDALAPAQGRGVFNGIFKTRPEDQEPVAVIRELSIPVAGGTVPARIYQPAEGVLPVLMHFHGGGWVFCDLDTHDAICRMLANGVGCTVVAIEYRKAPEHRYPVALEDCYAATRWIHAHGAELGLDVERMAVTGDSAGGNLAAEVALRCRDNGPALAAQVLNYPAVDANMEQPSIRANGEGYFLTRSSMDYFLGHYFGALSWSERLAASPLHRADLAGLAPAYVCTAEFDPLVDEGDLYASRLREAGNEVVHDRVPVTFHGFLLMSKLIPDAGRVLTDQYGFLRRKLSLG